MHAHALMTFRPQSGPVTVERDGLHLLVHLGPYQLRLSPNDALRLAEALEQAVANVPEPTGHRK